jgi:hypothetical protein
MVAGSFINSYVHDLDELANYREGLEEREMQLTGVVDELTEPEAEAAALTEEADRVEAAFAARGDAVAALIRAEQLSIAIGNPTTFGTHHGVAIPGDRTAKDDEVDDEMVGDGDIDIDAEMQRMNANSNGSGK